MPQDYIFEDLTIIEIFDFTRVSERMRDYVESEFRKESIELIIHFEEIITFHFISMTDNRKMGSFLVERPAVLQEGDSVFHQTIGQFEHVESAYLEPTNQPDDFVLMMGTYWADYLEGAKALFKELDAIFHVPINHVFFDLMRTGDSISPMVDWINELSNKTVDPENPFIKEIIVGGICEYHSWMWLMDNLKPKGRMEFKFIGILETPEVVLDVRISKAYWVRPYHFESWTKATKVLLLDSTLSNPEILEVILRIKQGNVFKNLVGVVIYFRGKLDASDVLIRMNAAGMATPEDAGHRYHIDFGDGYKCILRFTQIKSATIDALGMDMVLERKKNEVVAVQGTEKKTNQET